MKLYEYEAKRLYAQAGIEIPRGNVIASSDEAVLAAKNLGTPVVLKAQILAGGRGKAGGIKFADSPEKAKEIASVLLGSTIKGHIVSKLLVEQKLAIAQEIYLGVTIDREARKFVAIVSPSGGIDIEEIARNTPERIVKTYLDPEHGLQAFQARNICKKAGFTGESLVTVASFLRKLWQAVLKNDAELAEINPLIRKEDGAFVAADARMIIDDNALFRHHKLKERLEMEQGLLTPLELQARKAGMAYVELDGNIGIIGNGAGLVMSTMDTVKLFGGHPANFLDVGGGASTERMETALRIIRENPRVKILFINIMAGITRCDEMAQGILNGIKERSDLRLVIRMVGTREKEGREILEAAGIRVFDSMDEAAKAAVHFLK
ncbi:MAG: ADP-forming succinate--CoA ligase subunit beta [Candidatus Ranarchaeia archaeon]